MHDKPTDPQPLKKKFDRYACLSIRERILQRSKKISSGCIVWTGTKSHGYGVLNLYLGKNKNYLAHRLAYELANGPILDKSFVLHSCDNPQCVNPKHLFLGSQKDNMLDKQCKHRAAKAFSPADVQKIRELIFMGRMDVYIAKKYKVTPKAVRDIRVGNTWRHVK